MTRRALETLVLLVLWPRALLGAEVPSEPDPFVLLEQGPWPGMTALDVVWCKELVFSARVVEVREGGSPPRLLWVKDARGWLKPNGFYGLKINGQPVDEATLWILYGGAMVNLRALFTYGSVPFDAQVPEFRD